ncbi:hypothetical protein P153DRAFT_370600 [Dothidotthia symphoricarpi CBS 119687]|uniref:Radical SAM core domain-containing protein n=1 Tax=Dothidotthia symphoricarpi CBS 119687 TaxID=1392245 RepID=A0A6A6A0L4_9PLEO|nr:uncharacterized protein P153DRAFT_370600 [Dothidotthia symphoricarpi CBS 119687]KAF2124683.1 hypothetical protein P153DRAFT_370600 [Dothidotthia symphoricarpi CBS 119687]
MTSMVKIRPSAKALRSTVARGECAVRQSRRALPSRRGIATDAAVREPGVEQLPGGVPPVVSSGDGRGRREAIKTAKPFSDFLTDTYQRQHDYLRISITERCNLRCLYCMPEEGIPLSPAAHMLTTPEIFYLSSLFVSQGVTKIRLTGGEPTIRRDIVPLMQQIGSLRAQGLRELALTTNGIALHRKLDAMVEAGLTGVNLSLDTLDPFQFQIMTRRNGFDAVVKSIDRILEMNRLGAGVKLKVNCVVMRGLNEREIIPFVELGREKDIEVRFIEYMPFGGNKWSEGKMISFQEMLDVIRTKYPALARLPGHKNDTSKTYAVPGFVGKVGFISSMTNDFCGTCNRLRITSDGNLKVCLHGNDEVSLRDLLRKDNGGEPIDEQAFQRIKQMEMDRRDGRLSDKTTLGWGPRERELLQVIGGAVKRKAEKHADMGDLANMQNRPMILIDRRAQPDTLGPYPHTSRCRRSIARPKSSVLLSSRPFLNHHSAFEGASARAFSTSPVIRTQSLPDETSRSDNTAAPSAHANTQPTSSRPETGNAKASQPQTSSHLSLSPSLEAVREKYQLTGQEWDPYWLMVRGSTRGGGRTVVKKLDFRAHGLLRNIQEIAGRKHPVPSHNELMREARHLREKVVESVSQYSTKANVRNVMALMGEMRANHTTSRLYSSEQEEQLIKLHQEKEDLEGKKLKLMELLGNEEEVDPWAQSPSKLGNPQQRRDALLKKSTVVIQPLEAFKVSKPGYTLYDPNAHINNHSEETQISPELDDTPKHNTAVRATPVGISYRPLSENLRLSVPSSNTIKVDDDLTVNFEADVPDLQRQIFQLQERLKSVYPRIDALPYDVWSSTKHNTLRTWLKILISRWQTRFDDAMNEGVVVDEQVKKVLDDMVRNHDLSNAAAERMAMRWNEVFNRRQGSSSHATEAIDWEEYEAGGLGFLMDGNEMEVDDEVVTRVDGRISWRYTLFAKQQKSRKPKQFYTLPRHYSTSTRTSPDHEMVTIPGKTASPSPSPPTPTFPHLTPTGSAHMVSVSSKPHTTRTAIAVGTVYFSNPTPLSLIRSNSLKKGDVLSVSRIAGIMAAKKCPDLIPLCHPIALTHVGVELRAFASEGKVGNDMGCGGVQVEAKVQCTGPTGVEMEALTSVMGTTLSIVDMCKAVDKFQTIQDVRVVLKEGGKSGVWREEGWKSWQS